jgi:hypothetical protein
MDKKQWYILSGASFFLSYLFIKISLEWKARCELDEVIMTNIFACIRGEIFSPLPYIFLVFGLAFILCSWLEGKKK